MPVRCQRQRCSALLQEHESGTMTLPRSRSEHSLAWPGDPRLHAFCGATSGSVTTAWLRQISRQLVYHFASFKGEVAVHQAEAVYGDGDFMRTRSWRAVVQGIDRVESRSPRRGVTPCTARNVCISLQLELHKGK